MMDLEETRRRIQQAEREIIAKQTELAALRAQLAAAEEKHGDALEAEEYQRYGRQIIVPGYGVQAQQRLKKSRVLIVGAGGLGCPAAAYVAGAGVGTLGIVDGDVVEVSNLHRQIAHATERVGVSKVLSAITYLKQLNPRVTYTPHPDLLSPSNAASIISQYDVVLDCTDHPAVRYLVSDTCVLLRRPLVSASAFQTSGQLVVLNDPPGRGPCYRCVFPRPPPPESVVGCGEGGILGPVVGVMGVLQALEAVRLIARGGLEWMECRGETGGGGLAEQTGETTLTEKGGGELAGMTEAFQEKTGGASTEKTKDKQPGMMILSAGGDKTTFRSVRLRGKRPDCFACSASSSLSLDTLASSIDYVQFCGVAKPVSLLTPDERISVHDYCALVSSPDSPRHLVVDVREKEHFSLGSLPGAVNVPMSRINRRQDFADLIPSGELPIYVVCRVGNDSQIAVRKLKEKEGEDGKGRFIADIIGGIRAWKEVAVPTLPFI